MARLAINGGPKVRTELFPSQNTYDDAELKAVERVMKRGRLSWYRGNGTTDFYGGPEIRALETEWQERFNVKHAICCNSATSGLHIATGAIGMDNYDKVIVSPYSMTCSATIPLAWGACPVFADVESDYFCIDYASVKDHILGASAIIAVSLFGQPFDPRLKEFKVPIIEDAAQALNSIYIDPQGKLHYAGTLGDIGVYSFNFGKHLTCGEGGMIVTNNDDLALRCRLIMNHGESVIHDCTTNNENGIINPFLRKTLPSFIFGFNLRMTEIQAAIIREQLKKLPQLVIKRKINANMLRNSIDEIPPIKNALIREGCYHSYYALPFLWDKELADGLHRDVFINAVKAELTPRIGRDTEGVPIGCGYITPIYKMPVFSGYPNEDIDQIEEYPNVEELWKNKLFLTLYHAPNSTKEDMQDVIDAFEKVWEHKNELRRE